MYTGMISGDNYKDHNSISKRIQKSIHPTLIL